MRRVKEDGWIYLYWKRTMKHVEIALRGGKWDEGEWW
jgi:hypothetical protein